MEYGRDGAPERESAPDLPRLFKAVAARKRRILIPTLLGFAAAVAFVVVTPPRYTGVVKVLLENQESYLTRPDKATIDTAPLLDPEAVESQAEVVTTPAVARKAIEKLHLADRPEFRSAGVFSLLTALTGGSAEGSPEDRLLDTFMTRVTAFAVSKSRVVQIEFSSTDPALAAEGANTIADVYLASLEQAKSANAKSAASWLSVKIEQLRGKVAEADAKVEALKSESGLQTGANGLTAPTQQLAEIISQIAIARAAQSAAMAKAAMLKQMLAGGRLDSVPDIAKDESIRRYLETRVSLKAQIAEQARTMLPNHPRMKELNGQLAGLEAEIRAAALKSVRGFEDEAQLSGAQVKNLEAAISDQSKAVAAGDSDQVRLRALELDAKTARDQLESYLAKYREALARDADNAAPPDARIIAAALQPRSPSFPKKVPTVLIGTLGALFLSLGAVVAGILLTDEAAAPAVRMRAPAPNVEPDAFAEIPASDVADLVDSLASAAGDGPLTLLVTGEGAPGALFAALTAGRSLAARGRAALVDLGAPQAWLFDVLDPEELPPLGLSDALAGRIGLDEALRRDLSSRLDILPAGSGLVAAEGLEAALDALTQSYRFLIVHASDWRAPAARAALGAIAAVIVCAPADRLPMTLARVRRALPEPSIVTTGLAFGAESGLEKAA